MDIAGQKSKLNSDIILFTRIGAVSALIAVIPLIWALVEVLGNHAFFKENELGDFIGGTSGTFASFAGLAFVYVAFLGQRLQILMQQEELELNRQEMKDTRIEIQGQKEQLVLQNKQFQRQSFESVFFSLIELFQRQSTHAFSSNYGEELMKKMPNLNQNIKSSHANYNWKNLSIDKKREQVGVDFDFSFSVGFGRISTLIQSSLGVLAHLDKNRDLIDHQFYLKIFYNQLNVHESRIIFYGFFSERFKFNHHQLTIYREFLKIFLPQHLCSIDDIKLI